MIKTAKELFDAIDDEEQDENPNHYNIKDNKKYAKKYYGETYHETTRFDNDWD